MASGTSGTGRDSGSKASGFGSGDVLCSYEDYSNGNHSDLSDFPKSRMAKSSVYPVANYSPPEESSYHQDVVSSVENTMKKHADNIIRFLEGLSSRVSQLELYCYNIDKSIGEMRSDLIGDHGVSESKLKSREKHMQEVHRSVQVLKDKQELADTQKELAKLQLAQNDSTRKGDEKVSPSSEPGMDENPSDAPEQRLALALPHQVAPLQPPITARPVEHQPPPMPPPPPPSSVPQVHTYYTPPPQMSNVHNPSQAHYLSPPQSQIQDHSRVAPPPPPVQSQVNQNPPPVQSVPPYQQQWPQQQQQTVQQQLPLPQPQIRNPHPQMTYSSSYIPTHPIQSSQDVAPNIMSMQGSFRSSSLPGSESMPYRYGSSQPPTPNVKISSYGPQQPVDTGYVPSGPHQAPPLGSGYTVYGDEGGRLHHHHIPSNAQPHYQQNVYPLATNAPQRMSSPNMAVPQPSRGHPSNDLIEKLVGMGYRGDRVVGMIQRLEESGQPVDFNGVLDMLNGHGGGGSQRGWSG